MHKGLSLLFVAVMAAVGLAQQRTWELREGRWEQVAAPATQTVRDATLDRAEELLAGKRPEAARDLLASWFLAENDSPLRDRAIYLLGEANFMRDDRIGAFHNFEEIITDHPASPYYHKAMQRQYDIADAFLSGHKIKLLGIGWQGAEDEAVEMMYRIQQYAPGSALAEKALLRTADYYYARGESEIDAYMPLAADAYAFYVRTYPRGSELPRAKLRRAFATLRQFRGENFDATAIIDARQQLSDLKAAYPELAEKENIQAIVRHIDATLAEKAVGTGELYSRMHKPRAAALYYKFVIDNFPDTAAAAKAKELLDKLPPDAKEKPATRPAKAVTK